MTQCVLSILQAADGEERKRLLKRFTAEREAAKARILAIGNQLLPPHERQAAAGQ